MFTLDTAIYVQGDPKGQFAVQQIRVVETMPCEIFGKDYAHLYPFQVILSLTSQQMKWSLLCIAKCAIMKMHPKQQTVKYYV